LKRLQGLRPSPVLFPPPVAERRVVSLEAGVSAVNSMYILLLGGPSAIGAGRMSLTLTTTLPTAGETALKSA
jgi:hypothetical protein